MDVRTIAIADVTELILKIPTLNLVYAHVANTLKDDPAHDVDHAMRVALWAMRVSDDDCILNAKNLIAASLLHDVVNIPKNSADRRLASEMSAKEAINILKACDQQNDTFNEEDLVSKPCLKWLVRLFAGVMRALKWNTSL